MIALQDSAVAASGGLLGAWDWAFVIWFLAVTLGVGVWYSKRASQGLDEYFLSGRKLPWWALGTSMVATTFAADTPIVVAGFVVAGGIAQNWVWWNFLFGATLTVFVFARWWRRAEVVTEIELIEKRYGDDAPARALRGFKAVFLGLVINAIIFGFVTKAMMAIVDTVFDVEPWISLTVLLVLTFFYTMLSGLWGVVATDVLQFVMALLGAVLLAVLAVSEVGGLDAMVAKLGAIDPGREIDFLAVFPTGWNTFSAGVLILVVVNWWAVYYPGAEPGGGGYVAQRMSAALDERHARAGTLWFVFCHYVLRPWPWVLVALCAIVLEPNFAIHGAMQDPPPELAQFGSEKAYPSMFRLLPVGVLGLVVASFFAAFMSTITTTLNLSASYLVNDLYLPFFAREGVGADDRSHVLVARIAVAVVAAVGATVSYVLATAGEGWTVIMDLTAGVGPVLILRWLWWRVNAWSEISAMLASAVAFVLTRGGFGFAGFDETVAAAVGGPAAQVGLLMILTMSVAVWLPVTLLTPPAHEERLRSFYSKVRPGGAWRDIPTQCGLPRTLLGRDLLMWAASTALIFGALLGLGGVLLQRQSDAITWGIVALVGLVALRLLFAAERRAEAGTESPS